MDWPTPIAANAPLTVAAVKQHRAAKQPRTRRERDLAQVRRHGRACFASQDYVEGRRAFMEKRKPAFTGAEMRAPINDRPPLTAIELLRPTSLPMLVQDEIVRMLNAGEIEVGAKLNEARSPAASA